MIWINQQSNQFSNTAINAPGWESVTIEHFNSLRAAGWNPTEPRRQETDVILQRLTPAEAEALFTARRTSWEIDRLITRASTTGVISESDPDFPTAVAALNQAQVILAARWDDLLAP